MEPGRPTTRPECADFDRGGRASKVEESRPTASGTAFPGARDSYGSHRAGHDTDDDIGDTLKPVEVWARLPRTPGATQIRGAHQEPCPTTLNFARNATGPLGPAETRWKRDDGKTESAIPRLEGLSHACPRRPRRSHDTARRRRRRRRCPRVRRSLHTTSQGSQHDANTGQMPRSPLGDVEFRSKSDRALWTHEMRRKRDDGGLPYGRSIFGHWIRRQASPGRPSIETRHENTTTDALEEHEAPRGFGGHR